MGELTLTLSLTTAAAQTKLSAVQLILQAKADVAAEEQAAAPVPRGSGSRIRLAVSA